MSCMRVRASRFPRPRQPERIKRELPHGDISVKTVIVCERRPVTGDVESKIKSHIVLTWYLWRFVAEDCEHQPISMRKTFQTPRYELHTVCTGRWFLSWKLWFLSNDFFSNELKKSEHYFMTKVFSESEHSYWFYNDVWVSSPFVLLSVAWKYTIRINKTVPVFTHVWCGWYKFLLLCHYVINVEPTINKCKKMITVFWTKIVLYFWHNY